MNPDALIIFCRYPEYGRVKTRIAVSLGNDFTLGLYNAFIKDLMAMSKLLSSVTIIAVDAPELVADHSLLFGIEYPIISQKGGDIGQRMLNAVLHVFNLGHERVVLVGCDLPDLPAEIIEDAFKSLNSSDAVLGRSNDGGYYLIGLKNSLHAETCFTGIDWGTPKVFQQTVDNIKKSGKTLSFAPEWHDIDDREGLRLYYNKNIHNGNTSSHTMKYLVKHINDSQIKL